MVILTVVTQVDRDIVKAEKHDVKMQASVQGNKKTATAPKTTPDVASKKNNVPSNKKKKVPNYLKPTVSSISKSVSKHK